MILETGRDNERLKERLEKIVSTIKKMTALAWP